MPAKSPVQRRVVAEIAAIERWHGPGDSRIPPLRAELATELLAAHIAEVVAAAPPLTPEQADRLRSLLPAPAGARNGS
jgi:hypothetical protein